MRSGVCETRTALSAGRRSRFPYRFKHHAVNLLAGGGDNNRLISTDVLMGSFADAARRIAVTSRRVSL